jgi:L-alanine-DL-glutamate epimerase-like enolase superfamily enzyme
LGAAPANSELGEHKLAAVEFRQIDLTWPRHVGKNSRRDVHGYGPKPTVVILKTNQGAAGWGMITGSRNDVETLQQKVLGKTVAQLFDPASGILSNDLRPLDIPLHDLAGVILGQPVWRMLGGKTPGPMQVYSGMVYFDDLEPEDKPAGVEKVLENARWDHNNGYRQLKVKIGRGGKWMPAAQGLARDIEVVREIHRALPDCTLLVDGNDMFTVDTIISFLKGIEGIELFWIEEPFHETVADWRKLRSWLGANGRERTWRADGEASPDYKVLDELATDLTVNVRLDDIHGYGFTRWRKLLPELKEKRITSSPHAWGSGLNTVYIGHLGAGLGNVLTVEGVTCSQKDVDFGGNRIRNGLLGLSSKPGFGLQLRGS